jgi:hypothetical protein
MNQNANTASNATTAASSTYYYARIGNPRSWMKESDSDNDTIQYEAMDWCNHRHRTAEAALYCLDTLDSCGYFYPVRQVIEVDAEGRRPIDLCAIEVTRG